MRSYTCVLFVLIISILSSCNSTTEIERINEHFDITDSVNYINCKDLQGIGELKINISTIKDIKKIFNSIQSPLKDYLQDKFEPKFNKGFTNISYNDTLHSLLLKETSIRQYDLCGLFGKYKIGDIKLDDIYLLCYNDTLIGIKMRSLPDIIKEIFINKYGTGQGSYIKKCVYPKNPKDDIINVDENRIWKNKSVIASYSLQLTNKPKIKHRESFEITDNTGKMNQFYNELEAIHARLKKEKEDRMKKSIEMI